MHLVSRACKATGLSQTDLAPYLGVRPQQLSRWLKGANMSAPSVSLLLLVERLPGPALTILGEARGLAPPATAPPGIQKEVYEHLRSLHAALADQAAASRQNALRSRSATSAFNRLCRVLGVPGKTRGAE